MTGSDKCLLCENPAKKVLLNVKNGDTAYICPKCGSYSVPGEIKQSLLLNRAKKEIRYYVSCFLRRKKDSHEKNFVFPLTEKNIDWILRNEVPDTAEEKVESLLDYVNCNSSFFGALVPVDKRVSYSQKEAEFQNIVREMEEQKLLIVLRNSDGVHVSLTMKGIEFLNKTRKRPKEDNCFIAMWFDPEMGDAYIKCFEPACIDAGYKPIRVDQEFYNGDVTDRIIGNIRTTQFTIADMTGYRGGVYYEAGFAKGLGKQVIFTCRTDWFDKDPEKNRRVHFDLTHENFITWDSNHLDLFRQQLIDRIIATIGKGSYICQ